MSEALEVLFTLLFTCFIKYLSKAIQKKSVLRVNKVLLYHTIVLCCSACSKRRDIVEKGDVREL